MPAQTQTRGALLWILRNTVEGVSLLSFPVPLIEGSITRVLILDHISHDWEFWVEMQLSTLGLHVEYLFPCYWHNFGRLWNLRR